MRAFRSVMSASFVRAVAMDALMVCFHRCERRMVYGRGGQRAGHDAHRQY